MFSAAKARSTSASSPSRVLAATHTGREPIASRQARPRAASSGGVLMSNFRLPSTARLRAPSAPSRSASDGLCASTREKPPNTSRTAGPKREARRNERADMRALVSTSGTEARRHSSISVGQTSVSITSPSVGRQARRKRRTRCGMS